MSVETIQAPTILPILTTISSKNMLKVVESIVSLTRKGFKLYLTEDAYTLLAGLFNRLGIVAKPVDEREAKTVKDFVLIDKKTNVVLDLYVYVNGEEKIHRRLPTSKFKEALEAFIKLATDISISGKTLLYEVKLPVADIEPDKQGQPTKEPKPRRRDSNAPKEKL